MKLELGSGYHPTPGYVHLDANPNAPGVDIVGKAFPLPLVAAGALPRGYPQSPHGGWDEIRAVDVLEHISYRDTAAALDEWHDALAPGGRLFVQVPDAETCIRWFAESPTRLVQGLPPDLPQTPLAGLTWRLLGGHADGRYVQPEDDWRLNAHYALFSRGSLMRDLAFSGFDIEECTVNFHPNVQAWAVKP